MEQPAPSTETGSLTDDLPEVGENFCFGEFVRHWHFLPLLYMIIIILGGGGLKHIVLSLLLGAVANFYCKHFIMLYVAINCHRSGRFII